MRVTGRRTGAPSFRENRENREIREIREVLRSEIGEGPRRPATWGDLGPGGRGSTPLHAGQSVLRRRARHQPRDGLRRGVGTMAHCGRWGRPSLPNPVPSEGGQP
mgnify:CR=1 FL=1